MSDLDLVDKSLKLRESRFWPRAVGWASERP